MPQKPIHPSIKARLGYDPAEPDNLVYADWKERLRRVCKPCWELKYCPYGPLVEQSPILPGLRSDQVAHKAYLQKCVETNTVGSIVPMTDEWRATYDEWLDDDYILAKQVLFEWHQKERFAALEKVDEPGKRLDELLGRKGLPPIQEYRVQYDPTENSEICEEDFEPEVWQKLLDGIEDRRKKLTEELEAGEMDNRTPLEPTRKEMFLEIIASHDPENLPEEIPNTFRDGECSIFGHICPVFFAAEIATESNIARRIGRRHLRFETMMRIVRRDDYRCQHCKKKLRDDEVEFDHIIPVSKGGSSEEHNMRLTCYDCNRDKSDKYEPRGKEAAPFPERPFDVVFPR